MTELTPDQAHLLVHALLLGTLKTESRTTRAVLAAVPDERADYRPDPNAKSALELARHIAVAEIRFLECVACGTFDPAAGAAPEHVRTATDVARWYEEAFAKSFAALAGLSGQELTRSVDFRGMFTRPAYFFLQLCLLHSVHHRGQLSTYLRPMGGKVPAIYGESYDSAAAKRAQA